MHIAHHSFTEVFLKGNAARAHPLTKDVETWMDVGQGAPIAKVGPKGRHLHFATNDSFSGTTMPVAFSDYEASDDKGKSWRYVERGMPKVRQYIRHPQQ